MFSSSTSAVFRFIGWYFLPSALANGAINVYYHILKPSTPPPRRGSPAHTSQYRIAFTALAAAYFIYTLVAAVTSLQPNYYRILGVERNADEQALKAAFRQFARKNHPDRPGIGPGGSERFRDVRDAYEMLKNPAKRFGYERFGPEIISWKNCTTYKEYMMRGISASSGFPIGTAVVLGLMSVLGQSSSSSFWRYVTLATVLFAEAYLILSPTVPLSFGEVSYAHNLPLLSSLLPYQQIIVLHQAFVSLSGCIAQLGPVLFPNFPQNDKEVLRAVSEVTQRIAEIGGAAEHEVNRMIQSDLHALRGVRSTALSFTQASAEDDAMIDTLAAEMESVLIDARLRAHPVIGTMWERVADDARDRVTSVVSPISQGFAGALPQQNFRVDKGIFTSPPASPVKIATRNMNRMYHSRATSPITPSSPTLSLPSHVDHRPFDAESIYVSESEQSETGSAATLLELDRRSRSDSPFTYVGPVRQRTVSRATVVASDHAEVKLAGLGAGPMAGDGQTAALSSILTLRSPPHSLGKSSGSSMNQALTQGNGGPATSGAKFFTSSFSKMADT